MCGIMFKTNYYSKTLHDSFNKAVNCLAHRGPDEDGILYTKDYSFGHRRLSIRDLSKGHQPMSILDDHLLYNGEIYNFDELNKMLKNPVESRSDTELLLRLLMEYKEEIIDKIIGIFAFVYVHNDEVIIARDHVGVKPLYYSFIDNDILVASEIKALLTYGIKAQMGLEQIAELVTLAPSNSPGETLFKNIYELKPGYYLKFSRKGMTEHQYFKLKRIKNNLSYEDNVSMVRYLLLDSIKRNLVSDVGISSFLSGGLDSSIVASVTESLIGQIDTYSIDYEGNKTDFKANSFESSRDEDYVGYLTKRGKYNHKSVIIDTKTVFDYLRVSMHLRDAPGMADIDSSMLYLSKEIALKHKVSLSGECADELFGGYPWFKNKDIEGFPWIRNIEQRIDLVRDDIKDKIDLKAYLNRKYEECIKEAPLGEDDTDLEKRELQMNYLNLKYFMTTLLHRKDFMTMGSSLEVRVPFADKRIVEFCYNLPYEQKAHGKLEKQILRDAMKDYLPKEIYERKKSPYPKSQSKNWHRLIKAEVIKLLDKETPLAKIFDIDKLRKIALSDKELDVPWFGQLMRYDAFMAFIYQIHYWLNDYNIEVII